MEWVALVLVAALVLGAGAALAGGEADRGLGRAVAKRISGTARGAGAGSVTPSPLVRKRPKSGRFRTAPDMGLRGQAAPPPPRAADAFRSVRGIADVAKHAWIVCVGYERWRHELEHPSAPTEPLPVDVALSIVNTCFNPHDYLLGED